MKKNYLNLLTALLIAVCGMSIASCSSDDSGEENTPPVVESVLGDASGIIKIESGIGDFDAAYLTKLGYFCYKKDASSAADKYSAITYMPEDGSDMVSLIATKADNIPTQMVTKNGTIYFSFPDDKILELLYDDGTGAMTMLNSVEYSKEELAQLTADANGDAFKATLSAAASLLNKNVTRSSLGNALIEMYGKIFGDICGEPYVSDEQIVGSITVSESGNFVFTEVIDEWYETEIEEFVCNVLSLWTGEATFKVGGSSCTLSGTIWCPLGTFNIYGTYGIICDEDQSKLYLGSAEYEGAGFQDEDDLSYSVDFRGFKPNTTYYYRAYYKFTTSDHGGIVSKYADSAELVIYDPTIKSFTTGENALTVDVVMCIDVTGSMSGIINTVKKNAIDFYDSFNNHCEKAGIRLTGLNSQVVAFQDINVDGDRWMNISETYSLPEQKSEFDSFVNGLRADNGGDTPESGLEALDVAFNKTDWGEDDGYHRQVIILWTDAPYLVGTNYTSLTVEALKEKWDEMPSGRRLILFAPNGTGYSTNAGDWRLFDDWKNVIHSTDLSNGFNNFDHILESIIGELTSKEKEDKSKAPAMTNVFFRPNN